ncbi:MAG TPA: serine/threonine-protein kinase [Steroidobacteraceae bacterium]|nr:serine/threonine-protein kinase [Steroidobacteraceae bacterium]
MSQAPDAVATIIERARLLGPRERSEYLRRACGSDETLMSNVLLGLGADASRPGFWDEVAAGESDMHDDVHGEALEGQRLGPYRIVRKLGSGGMGDVYLAERADDEYQQQVAIKLVRSGVFSRQVQGRLRMERQILATLQHPNIARLLDGGRAPDGTPYLVMEYIDGEPIDVYCDRRRLSIEERIGLVRTVCAAVHYAHQNLIVHRDLKPNNILITPQGVPKLLDFGIAKLLDTRQSAQTLAVTHAEYRVMTPAHASPEQVRGDTITTASDIYVLGVLLYELLCGRRPFQLAGASLLEMERIICEQEAPSPSEMVARTSRESPELLTDIVACRSTTLPRLQKHLRGEIDSIVGMAMRKEVERRYSSAEQLAADLERHLDGKPVLASKDTWLYRTRKFVGRHKLAVAASTAAIVTLAAFATITFVQAQRIAYERDVATAERSRAEQVSSFLVELFELSDPSRSRGNQVTARELLDIGARRVNLGLTDQPETRATLLGTIGTVYQSLGLYSDSVTLLEEGLESRIRIHGPRHPAVAVALRALGDALCDRGELAQCEARLNAALEMQRALLGPDSLEIAPTLTAQAKLAQLRGDFDTAERLYDQSLQSYRAHGKERTTDATSVMNELAGLYSYRGRHDRAETLYRAALDIDRQALGNDHPQIGMHLQNLAVALHEQGKLEEAAPLYQESMQILQRVLGERHPQTLDAAANYGRFLHRRGELARAEEILTNVVALDRQARGARHAFVAHDLVNLGMVRLDMQRAPQAEQDFRAALDIYAETLPADHPYVASALVGLGRSMLEQQHLSEAEQTLRRAKAIAAKSFAADSPQLAAANSSLGRVLMAQRRMDEAAQLLRESYPILLQMQGENAVITQRTREAIAQLDAAR